MSRINPDVTIITYTSTVNCMTRPRILTALPKKRDDPFRSRALVKNYEHVTFHSWRVDIVQ